MSIIDDLKKQNGFDIDDRTQAVAVMKQLWSLSGGKYGYLTFGHNYVPANKKHDVWKERSVQIGPGMDKHIADIFKEFPRDSWCSYFSMDSFSEEHRRKELACVMPFLFADLDNVNINSVTEKGFEPSLYWESSPGHYYAIWFIDGTFETPAQQEVLNKRLTNAIGADRSGYDLTQVFRIPYSLHLKDKANPKQVGGVTTLNVKYTIVEITKKLDAISPAPEQQVRTSHVDIPNGPIKTITSAEFDSILERYAVEPDVKKNMLKAPVKGEDRSDQLAKWYINLRYCRMSEELIAEIIKFTPWNKFDSDIALRVDIARVFEKYPLADFKSEDSTGSVRSKLARIASYSEVMSQYEDTSRWLVDQWWPEEAFGYVAGVPKCGKSILTTDLALSVASGKPLFGIYPVNNPGPVLIIQNENAAWIMQDRMYKISTSKNLGGQIDILENGHIQVEFPKDLDIDMFNCVGFTFDDPVWMDALEQQLSKKQYRLIIFDPLYLMTGISLDKGDQVSKVVQKILRIRDKYHVAIIVVHHYKKDSKDGPKSGGQRMGGSIHLYSSLEAAWYLKKLDADIDDDTDETDVDINKPIPPMNIVLEREFRGFGNPEKSLVTVDMGKNDEYIVSVKEHFHNKKSAGRKKAAIGMNEATVILDAFNSVPINQDGRQYLQSVKKVTDATGLTRRPVERILAALVKAAAIKEEIGSNGGVGYSRAKDFALTEDMRIRIETSLADQ